MKRDGRRRRPLRLLSETNDGFALTLTDSDATVATAATATAPCAKTLAQDAAKATSNLRKQLGRLGNTDFELRDLSVNFSQPWFIPNSLANQLRREAVDKLVAARLTAYRRPMRRAERQPPTPYPEPSLSYLANVYNSAAQRFYERHGVSLIAAAYEAHEEPGEVSLMITRHCLRHSFSLCPKQAKGVHGVQGQVRAEPMVLVNGNEKLRLEFDCKACEMHVIGRIRKQILKTPPPSAVVEFHPHRPAQPVHKSR